MEPFDIGIRYQHLRVGDFTIGWGKEQPLFERLTLNEERLENPALFIDSMFYNITTSSLYLNGCQRQWSVVDGNKRLNAIKDFFENKFPLTQNFLDQKVSGMYCSDLSGKSYLKHRFHEYQMTANIFNPGMTLETINELVNRIRQK